MEMTTAALFGDGNSIWWILITVAAFLLFFAFRERFLPSSGKADALQKEYEKLPPERLAALPDEQLITAVIANLNAKLDPKHPDPYHELAVQSRGQYMVYSVWLVLRDIEQNGLSACLHGPSAPFVEKAVEGLALFGAEKAAQLLSDALTAPDSMADTLPEELSAAIASEAVPALMVDYIRNNPDEFADA